MRIKRPCAHLVCVMIAACAAACGCAAPTAHVYLEESGGGCAWYSAGLFMRDAWCPLLCWQYWVVRGVCMSILVFAVVFFGGRCREAVWVLGVCGDEDGSERTRAPDPGCVCCSVLPFGGCFSWDPLSLNTL
jgi:hypothetical protein